MSGAERLLRKLGREFVLLDGAMGTELQKRELLRPGECPEGLNLTHAEAIEEIHRGYVEAGADIVYTNTFGANACKLPKGLELRAVLGSAIGCARRAAAGRALVALDMGPTGKLLAPAGELEFEDACAVFREVVEAAEPFEPDLYVIETMSDLAEVKAALLAVKERSKRPAIVTMTFDASGRTFMGSDVRSMGVLAEAMGALAVGVNCSLAPAEMIEAVRLLRSATALPIVAKANAGLPDEHMRYSVDSGRFASDMMKLAEAGASVLGGCCGTDAGYIAAMAQLVRSRKPLPAPRLSHTLLCTPTRFVRVDGVTVIGERLNPTGKRAMREALQRGDYAYLEDQAIEQRDAGADVLDLNVGVPGIDEPAVMECAVCAVQSVVDLPLQIDSGNPQAVERALRVCRGKPIVNSVNGEESVLRTVLPLVKKYGAAVVGLTMDSRGIPADAEGRLTIAERILRAAEEYKIPARDVLIDPLTLTVGSEQAQARETLRALGMIRSRLGLNTVLGVSNVSFGMPERPILNRVFLGMALQAGLTMPILNPNAADMMDTVRAYRALSGGREELDAYVAHYAGRSAGSSMAKASSAGGGSDVFREAPEPGVDRAASPDENRAGDPLGGGAKKRNVAAGSGGQAALSKPAAPEANRQAAYKEQADSGALRSAQESGQATARREKGVPSQPVLSETAEGAVPETAAQRLLGELIRAICEGRKASCIPLAEALLEVLAPLDAIEGGVIPALDRVGALYESGKYFLPQLLASAEAAQETCAVIRARMGTESARQERGRIVLATVKGDVHDIGKNIVRTVLENYGFTVLDLGRDVEPQAVVHAVEESGASLAGLSALMTTTLPAMRETVALLKERFPECRVMVGGAVLTAEFAQEIGADFYARDAMESVRIAQSVYPERTQK